MFNKILISILAVSFLSPMAFAQKKKKRMESKSAKSERFERKYGMAGCGLGSLIFEDDGKIQILAATTNRIVGDQTFGITSGTSNCIEPTHASMASRMDIYIEGNRMALQNDIAKGQGESLAGLGKLIGCKNPDMLGSKMQNRYEDIFTSNEIQTRKITDNVIDQIQKDSDLSSNCATLAMK